jgi:hypothetical protein
MVNFRVYLIWVAGRPYVEEGHVRRKRKAIDHNVVKDALPKKGYDAEVS